MSAAELIIQLLKVAIGLAFGAYFRLVELRSLRLTTAALVGAASRGTCGVPLKLWNMCTSRWED
jgi:hypothetical protein